MSNVSENISRIQRVSAIFQSIFTVLIFCVPIITLAYWTFFNFLPAGLTNHVFPVPIHKPLSPFVLVIAFIVSLIPIFVVLFGVFNLKSLFKLYEKEVIFSNQNAEYILRFGYSLMAWVAANFIFVILISLVLTFDNPVGNRMVVAELNVQDIAMLIIGAVIVLISWVMKEATILKDEQKYTV